MGSDEYTKEVDFEEVVYSKEWRDEADFKLFIDKHLKKCKVCLSEEGCESLHNLFEEGRIMWTLGR